MENQQSCTEFSYQPLKLYCGDYVCNDNGVFLDGLMICNHPIMIVGRFFEVRTKTLQVRIAYRIMSDWQYVNVLKSDLAAPSRIINLAKYGINATVRNAKQLMYFFEYLEYKNESLLQIKSTVKKMGWFENKFIPYDSDIKIAIDDQFDNLQKTIRIQGDYDDWLRLVKKVRKYNNNIIPRIAMAVSFASALIEPCNTLPFILHIWGETEIGKTVCLMLAVSIWANPNSAYIQTFNATEVGYELRADMLNSLPLAIDELQILKNSNAIEKLIYMLCEGKGRSRGKKDGGLQSLPTWHNTIITTGEYPITNERMCGGAINRVVGVTSSEPIFNDCGEVIQTVTQSYGAAGYHFTELIKFKGKDKTRTLLQKHLNAIISTGKVSSKQALYASIILLADELAEEIFDDGVKLSVDDILHFLSGEEFISQNKRCYEYLRDYIDMYQNKFVIDKHTTNVSENIFGKIENDIVYFYSNSLRTIMGRQGFNLDSFLIWAKNHNLLIHDKDRYTTLKRISGKNPARCYAIRFDWMQS